MSVPNQILPHHRNATNYVPHKQSNEIRTKTQMINNCKEEIGGLVSTRTKIQPQLIAETVDIF